MIGKYLYCPSGDGILYALDLIHRHADLELYDSRSQFTQHRFWLAANCCLVPMTCQFTALIPSQAPPNGRMKPMA